MDGLVLELGLCEAEAEELAELEGEIEAEILLEGEVDELALADGLREADELELGERDDEGLMEALGLLEAEGLSEADALELGEIEAEGLIEELGLRLEEADCEADGDTDGEALPPRFADTREAFSLIGFQIAINKTRPAVRVFEVMVAMMSWLTIFSATTLDNSTEASGVASCQMSPASRSEPVVVVIKPVGVIAVPTAIEPEPATST